MPRCAAITQTIAQWTAESKPLDGALGIERAVHAIEDTIACMVAGAGDEGSDAVRRTVNGYGSGPVTVVGARNGAIPPLAALANGTSAHRVLDGVHSLRARHGFDAEQVFRVEALVGYGNKRNLCYEEPIQEMEARFSLHYCVAVALLYGRVSLSDFTPAALSRPAVRALLQCTIMQAKAENAQGTVAQGYSNMSTTARHCRVQTVQHA